MNKSSNDHLLGSITIFFLLALIASITLLIAAIVWLAEIIGSLIGALLLVGLITLFLSLFIYFATVRPAVHNAKQQLHTIYEVANIVHSGYSWIIKVVGAIFT